MEVNKVKEVVKYTLTVTEEELKQIYRVMKDEVEGQNCCGANTAYIYNTLKDIVESLPLENQCKKEIDRLANFIMKEIPQEIGKETSESAVDVAIRLMKDGIIKTRIGELNNANTTPNILDTTKKISHKEHYCDTCIRKDTKGCRYCTISSSACYLSKYQKA